MYHRNHYFRLVLFILLLIAFSGTLFLLLQSASWYAVLPAIGVVWMIYCIVNLFNRIPRKLSYFLNAVENEDSTLSFPENIGHKPTKEMHESLNRVNRLIQEVKLRNREQEQYYGLLLEQVATGIVVVNPRGSILLANRAAKELLNYPYLTHVEQLRRVDANLYHAFSRLQVNSRHQYVKVMHEEGATQLSLQTTSFLNHDVELRIISIHDISNELDANELDSWQKLIRVLTHEIMNSITPITSLSETLLKYYIPGGKPSVESSENALTENDKEKEDNTIRAKVPVPKSVDEKTIANTVKGLEVINERGLGLIHFVESYRKLTRLSKPVLKVVALKELFTHLVLLLESEPDFKRIQFQLEVEPPEISIEADEAQLSQVFINLIKNALQAVENIDSPKISISVGRTETGYLEVRVVDNGPGIPPEIMDQIFIPFFTTKENGSGIGLSLSRQVMRNHGGSIEVASSPGNTRFTLKFIQ